MNSQDPPSLILTSSAMFPTFRNIYLLLIQHIQFSLKTTILSPAANFWSPWVGQTVLECCWANGLYPRALGGKKILGREFFFDPYSYANLCLFRTFGLELAPHPLFGVSYCYSSSQLYFLEHLCCDYSISLDKNMQARQI